MRLACTFLALCPLLSAAPAASAARTVQLPVRAQSDAPEAASFKAKLNRKDVRIARVLTPSDPLMLMVVLDLTGDLSAIETAKDALIGAIEKLPPSVTVAVLRAQDGLSVLADPGADRGAAIAAIHGLTVSGRPGLLDTLQPVERIADSIGRKSQVRVAVLYITDSNVAEYREDFTNPVINSSDPHDLSRRFPEALIQEKMSKLRTLFSGYQTPLHVVQLIYRSDRLNEAYQNGLKQLSENLIGSSDFCRTRSDIPDSIQRTIDSIVAGYSLIIPIPDHTPPTSQVEVTAGDAPLVYRPRLELKEK